MSGSENMTTPSNQSLQESMDSSRSNYSHSRSYSERSFSTDGDEDGLPFFADATLDLEEAQCIAPTPDLTLRATLSNPESLKNHIMPLPSLGNGRRALSTDAALVPGVDGTNASVIAGTGAAGSGSNSIQGSLHSIHSNDGQISNNTVRANIHVKGSISRPPLPIRNVSIASSAGRSLEPTLASIQSQSQDSNDSGTLSPTSESFSLPAAGGSTSPDGASLQSHANSIQSGSISNNNMRQTNNTPRTPGRNITLNAIQGGSNHTNQPNYRPRLPRRPRDTKWIMAFLLTIPLLLLPKLLSHSVNKIEREEEPLHKIHKAGVPVVFTLIIGIILARIFYLSRGGGEGEDQRHLAGQLCIIANMASCFILPLLTITFYNLNVHGTLYNLIVMGLVYCTIRDIVIFAKLFHSGRIMVEGVNDGQRAFYRMVVNASLDILSRSLRCQSFYRVVVFLMCVQFTILLLLRKSMEYAIAMHPFWVVLVTVIGYWCVGVVIRLLSYLACGGVTAWFAQQSALMEDMERMRRREEGDEFDDDDDTHGGINVNFAMPEAYRNVGASAYSMGIEFDEGMDDDYGDHGHSGVGKSGSDEQWSSYSSQTVWSSNGSRGPHGTSTVKAFLASAMGISFGSIVHCALLGGAANLVWSLLRKLDWVLSLSPRFSSIRRGNHLQEMSIGDDSNDSSTLRERLFAKWQRLITASRAFVRNHNDLALCHVAAYYKSYTRAANDVISLVHTSGIESIIYEDIAPHLCSSISKSISGLIVIFTSQSLQTYIEDHMVICEILIISFAMCYTLIYTMMEPLQASIKAVYICFAQNHQSLSQAFPLLYHRLDRMSSEQVSHMV